MADILFYAFSSLALVAALLMVVSPSAVNGAMCMIVAFVSTAALFVLLEAYFIAIVQVMVYAGAVMVLFLFIIMLLNVEEGKGAIGRGKWTLVASILGFIALSVLILHAFGGSGQLPEPPPFLAMDHPEGTAGRGFPFTTSIKSFGYSLFSKYMLPFQVCGFLLLAGMIGVIVISKKSSEQLRAEANVTKKEDLG